MAIIFYGDKGQILRTVAEATVPPDDIADEDVMVLRRVLMVVMKDKLAMTPAQIRAAFAAAKRAVD